MVSTSTCYNDANLASPFLLQEAESKMDGNEWISPILKGLKRSSPTGLKITLKSVLNLATFLIYAFQLHGWNVGKH